MGWSVLLKPLLLASCSLPESGFHGMELISSQSLPCNLKRVLTLIGNILCLLTQHVNINIFYCDKHCIWRDLLCLCSPHRLPPGPFFLSPHHLQATNCSKAILHLCCSSVSTQAVYFCTAHLTKYIKNTLQKVLTLFNGNISAWLAPINTL